MADEQCSLYYSSWEISNLDTICSFFEQEEISLKDLKTKKIIALNQEGDRYETTFSQIKQNILHNKIARVIIWLNLQSDIIWRMRLNNNKLIYDFFLYYIDEIESKMFCKKIFEFFIKNTISYSKPFLGMFVDENGDTYDYDFDPFFLTDSEYIDYVTDLICTSKEKLKLIEIEPSFAVKELDNGYVCVSRYPEFLDYLLS